MIDVFVAEHSLHTGKDHVLSSPVACLSSLACEAHQPCIHGDVGVREFDGRQVESSEKGRKKPLPYFLLAELGRHFNLDVGANCQSLSSVKE